MDHVHDLLVEPKTLQWIIYVLVQLQVLLNESQLWELVFYFTLYYVVAYHEPVHQGVEILHPCNFFVLV